MTPAERKLLVELARSVAMLIMNDQDHDGDTAGDIATRMLNDKVRGDLVRAIQHVECEEPSKTCDSIGYPNGEKRICTLPRDHAERYHYDVSTGIRWICSYQEYR